MPKHAVIECLKQYAYQSFLVTSLFDSVCVYVACWVNFRQFLFLQVNFYTSKNFLNRRPLNQYKSLKH